MQTMVPDYEKKYQEMCAKLSFRNFDNNPDDVSAEDITDEFEIVLALLSGIIAACLAFKILLGENKQQHPGKLVALQCLFSAAHILMYLGT